MGAFYGGIAHVPLSALVLVCELAGNYDLLVPLMLALGVAFVALRKRTLYGAQPATQRDSPVHRDAPDARRAGGHSRVPSSSSPAPRVRTFEPRTSTTDMLRIASESSHQEVFPVTDAEGKNGRTRELDLAPRARRRAR